MRPFRRTRWLDFTIALLLIGIAAWVTLLFWVGISFILSPTDQQGEPWGIGDRLGLGLSVALLGGLIPPFFLSHLVVWLWQTRQRRRYGWDRWEA